jgi:RHS repeat-associated protein
MSKEKIFNKLMAIALCCAVITAVLPSNIFSPIESVKAEEDGEPAATRSNHDTQVKVLCPSNIRVNTWNGNFFYPISVLTIPGRGLSMGISMSYNSGWHNFTSRCGYGWQLSSNMFYIRDENGDIVIVRGDGSSDRYMNNDGTFLSPEDVYDTLREYEPGKYLLQNKYGTAFYFDSPIHKRVTRIQKPNGNALTFAYDSDMLLTNITDASGREVNFTYADDKLTSITDLQNRQIQFLYDANDNLISITDPLGNTMNYKYDSDHFLTSITDPRGDMTTITYSGGVVVNVTGELTKRLFSFDTENRITTMTVSTDDGDQITRFFYDVDGRISAIEDPLGNSVSMTWDGNNNLINITDANGNTATYTYDSIGNLLTVTDASNNTTTYIYESTYNKVTHITDADGHNTTFEYDAKGNLINLTGSLGKTTTFAYDSYGQLISIMDANGYTATSNYDSYGDITSTVDALNHATSFTYDNVGNMLTTTDSIGNITTFSYDKLNRLTSIINALDQHINYFYDANGNLISTTDAKNNSISYNYDALNRLTQVTDALGNQTNYTYDAIGNLKTITDVAGHSTTFSYDKANRLISETDPTGNATNYNYDAAGNLINRTDANSDTTIYTYDVLNKPTKIDYPGTDDVSYSYDAVGNLIGMSDSNVSVNYTYDSANRLTNVITKIGSLIKTVSYSYDDVGNRVTMTDPDGGVTTYTYDAANRLIGLTNPLVQTISYTYDDANRLIRKAYHNGAHTLYAYDAANRLLSLTNKNSSGTTISSYTYVYAGAGNRIKMTDADGNKTKYAYDDLYRLIGVSYPDSTTVNYTYDAAGNRIQLVGGGITTNYTYDTANRLLTAGSVNYTWDNNGNLISKTDYSGTTTYAYDHENRLISIIFPDGTTNKFTYYPDGRRMSKTDKSGATTYYFYNGLNALVETNSGGTTVARYTSGRGIDDWVSMDRNGSSYYYHKDGFGSVTGLTDVNETVAATYHYDAFGIIKNATETFVNPYRFTGREYDAESGLYYYRARYYDADAGRFLSKDPIWNWYNPQSLNVYVYVGNNPINYVDPLGMQEWEWTPMYYRPGEWQDVIQVYNTIQAERYKQYSYQAEEGFTHLTWALQDFFQPITTVQTPASLFVSVAMAVPEAIESAKNYAASIVDLACMLGGTVTDWAPAMYYGFQPKGEMYGWSIPEDVYRENLINEIYSPIDIDYDDVLPYGEGDNTGPQGGGGDGPGSEVGAGSGGGSVIESKPLDLSSGASLTYLQSNQLVTLEDVIPTEGPESTTAVSSTPGFDVSGITNAVDVKAIDFVNNASQVKAAVLVTETMGEIYEHDYSVCNRFHGYTLESAAPVAFPDVLPGTTDIPWFWYLSMTNDKFVEEAFIFTVFVDEDKASFTIDSRWLADYYPSSIDSDYEYVFNFRIWASSSEEAYKLLGRTLEKLSNHGTVSFANTAEPVHPTVIIKSAEYADEKIRMTVQSWLPETQAVRFFGTMRHNTNRNIIPFEYNTTIEPGVNIVELPAENMHDALVFTKTDGFLDKVFISNRIYLLVDDFSDIDPRNYLGGNSLLFLNNASIVSSYHEESLRLDYNVSFDNSYAGYMTLLNELDLTPYNSVTFLVKGENGGEKAKIGLVDSTNNEHKILISEYLPEGITTQWQKVRIPFAAFTQVVNWSTMAKLDISFENLLGSGIGTIYVDDLRFEQIPAVPIVVDNFNDMTGENGLSGLYWAFADGEAVIDAGYDTENKYGDTGAGYRISYSVSETNYTFLSSDLMVLNALGYNTLSFYIRGADGGEKPNIYLGDGIVRNFVNVEDYAPVTTSWQKMDIPLEDFIRQEVDITDLRYMQVVFERQEMNGTIYLDDITITKARRNYLLVDDFSDIEPKNCMVGNSSLFYNNASIWLNYADESLRLDYNVSSTNSYAGYITMLKEQDLTPYKSVTFLVKGENGGEKAKIGLVDSMNNEHKILISEYLPQGITTSWQKVRIPFAAFTQVVNRSSMAKLDISFENLLGSGIGTIYIADLKFEQIPVVPIVVDNFNDMTGENGLGGLYWAFADGGAVIDAGYDIENRHGDTGACYRITYNVTEANYTFLSSDFMVLNALGYNTLSFYIKGAKGGEKPNIYLFDGIERRFVVLDDYVPVTTFWQKVDIPLEDFIRQGMDISDLRYMQVVFEGAEMNGTVYLDDITITKAGRDYLLVDDFSDTDTRNCLGGNSSVFYNNASIGLNYSTESLQLGYDVSLNNSYAGYITMLNQWDLTPYNTVTFLVKGENGGEKAKICLVDSSNNEHKILISEYLPEGITTQWQEVRIPFAAFTQVINWYSMNKFDISFEKLLGSGEGTIYIDELKFEQIPGVPIVVDNFNDMTGENGLGGLYWTFADGMAVIDAGYDSENRYGDFGAGYRIPYSVTGTNYTFLSTDLTTLDAFGYNTLSFYIRGANGDEKPNVYLSDGIVSRFVNVEDYAPVTTSWQKIDIPLEDFIMQGVDITDLRYMQVVLEWEDMEGTIYLEDIQFYNPSPCFIATAAYGTALHDDINVLRDF